MHIAPRIGGGLVATAALCMLSFLFAALSHPRDEGGWVTCAMIRPVATWFPAAPGMRKQPEENVFHGQAYSRSDGTAGPPGSWTFWLLRKSKKVWFRLPESLRGADLELRYRYRGRPILHRPRWALLPAQEKRRLAPVILWGDDVAAGWGDGPLNTNHYLYIWTRWSLLHPEARAHPEHFSVTVPSRACRSRSTSPPPG